jgi:hypothetical protein
MMCSVSLAPADQLWSKHSNFGQSAKTPTLPNTKTPKPTIHPLLLLAFSREPDPSSVFCRQHPSSAAHRLHDINPFLSTKLSNHRLCNAELGQASGTMQRDGAK